MKMHSKCSNDKEKINSLCDLYRAINHKAWDRESWEAMERLLHENMVGKLGMP